jgi:GAF domain-containing protein
VSGNEELRAAFASGAVGSEDDYGALLRSIVETARAIFGARASSIFVLDEERDELVFAAVSGEGSDELVGRRLPSSTGIAGWVLVTRQPLVVEDVAADPRFGREAAESTGYVPRGLMAVPLLHDERALGVLEVLDRPERSAFSLAEMDLLALFANQAAIALDLLLRARRAREAADGAEGDLAAVGRLAAALDSLEGPAREAGLRLIASLEAVLVQTGREP